MFTTDDLPAALRLDPTAPHTCGHPDCTKVSTHEPEAGVPSNA